MVKHIIIWTLKEMPDAEKEKVKAGIKEGLEALKGKIPGLVDIKVVTEGRLASSTGDLMLDSTFESAEALKGYSKHPEHVAVADGKVRPYTASRACLDFEI
ncbi:MAG: Dabb family protein [Treponema sp.]|nr:Dabb family protein [Treponema sp.]